MLLLGYITYNVY